MTVAVEEALPDAVPDAVPVAVAEAAERTDKAEPETVAEADCE